MQRDLTGAEDPAAWQAQEMGSRPSREANLGETVAALCQAMWGADNRTQRGPRPPGHRWTCGSVQLRVAGPQSCPPAGCV